MIEYQFYKEQYYGISILENDFPRLATRADEEVQYFERIYNVSGSDERRNKAVCAIADAIYAAEMVANQLVSVAEGGGTVTTSVSIGSVSTSTKAPDVSALKMDLSEAGQRKQFYTILKKYMDVYRGVGGCGVVNDYSGSSGSTQVIKDLEERVERLEKTSVQVDFE